MAINIYDFDHTIYAGDSSVDFWLFCLKKKPSLLKFLPKQILGGISYYLGFAKKEQYKEAFFSFLNGLSNTENLVKDFWNNNNKNIKKWYLEQKSKEDIIISASPEFLLQPIAKELKIKSLIASEVDINTGHFLGKNCHDEEKVNRFKKSSAKNFIVDKVYSDSMSDMPIFKLGKEAYVVKKNSIIKLEDYKPSFIRKYFLNIKFIKFLFVGVLNAFLGVFLSYLYTKLFESTLIAFICGFATSLIPSYFLNTIITFSSHIFSVKLFIKYCISYIPNFIVQLISIYILEQTLHLPKIFTYIISVGISVPVTFILLNIFTFTKKGKHESK